MTYVNYTSCRFDSAWFARRGVAEATPKKPRDAAWDNSFESFIFVVCTAFRGYFRQCWIKRGPTEGDRTSFICTELHERCLPMLP